MLIKNLLYILQQENYELRPFLRFVYSHFNWTRLQKRSQLTWTSKAKAIYSLTWLLLLLFIYYCSIINPLGLIIVLFALPLIIVLSQILLTPLDWFLKKRLLNQARAILATKGKHLVVIGITGSYGKTSAREILSIILSTKFRVLQSPDNINTDLGIAKLIIDNQNNLSNFDIFVVEMGAFRKGEIKVICDLVGPDYSILTGINESHLEKFGSIENTIIAKFELPVATKKLSVLNSANELTKNNYQKFTINQAILTNPEEANNITFLPDFQGFCFSYEGIRFQTSLLAAHNIELILPCLVIAKELGLSLEACAGALKSLKPFPHRLQPIRNAVANLWIIDDSYNGNIDGFRSGLDVLRRATGRKLVLTPGLVEQGARAEAIHEQIGEMYTLLPVDLVLLIQNKYTDNIVNGLNRHSFSNYKIYQNTQAAHADLSNILKPGDTIIFQNDWPDNYF